MPYYVYLGDCLLPVTPEKLEIKINNQNETLTLVNEGEINVLKKAGLTDVEFECLIPQVKYPFANYERKFQKATVYLNKFESLKVDNEPFQFIVVRTLPNGKVLFSTNIKVSMEDYTIIEDSQNGLDLMVNISLKQYREYGTKTAKIKKPKKKKVTNSSGKRKKKKTSKKTIIKKKKSRSKSTTSKKAKTNKSKTYTVKKGDCLYAISRKFYGSGANWKKIYDANKKTIGSNPNLIYVGQKLKIPAK